MQDLICPLDGKPCEEGCPDRYVDHPEGGKEMRRISILIKALGHIFGAFVVCLIVWAFSKEENREICAKAAAIGYLFGICLYYFILYFLLIRLI